MGSVDSGNAHLPLTPTASITAIRGHAYSVSRMNTFRPARVFDRLGTATRPSPRGRLGGRAIVLGGSIAGLLAARVLTDHFDEVVIVEPDSLVDEAAPRHGVPQSRQVHTLLPAGRVQLDRWYDGFSDDLLAAGAGMANTENSRVYYNGRLKVAVPETEMVMSTRPFLEAALRRRAVALPNLSIVVGRAVGLDVVGDAVAGVRLDGGNMLTADFVVDATGRSTRLDHWLQESGWPAPPLQRMRVDINYTTALFHRDEVDPEVAFTFASWAIGRTPAALAPSIINAVEGDRWIVMMGGYAADKPGRTPDALRAICAELPPPFPQATAGELLEPITGYAQADSRRRDFHALSRFPARLAVVGDAAASFNPIYGQGMSSAALHASCLSEYLTSGPDLDRPARAFFDLQRVIVDAAWQTSAVPDLALPHVGARQTAMTRAGQAYANMLIDGTVTDVTLARRFSDVTFMRAHPSSLTRPAVAARTLALAAARAVRQRRDRR